MEKGYIREGMTSGKQPLCALIEIGLRIVVNAVTLR